GVESSRHGGGDRDPRGAAQPRSRRKPAVEQRDNRAREFSVSSVKRSDRSPIARDEAAGPILRAGGSDVARLGRGNGRRGGRLQKRKPSAMRNSRGNG